MSVIFRPSVKRTEGRDLVARFHNHDIKMWQLALLSPITCDNAVTCAYYVAVLKLSEYLVVVLQS